LHSSAVPSSSNNHIETSDVLVKELLPFQGYKNNFFVVSGKRNMVCISS
jgi:hypothetical protein